MFYKPYTVVKIVIKPSSQEDPKYKTIHYIENRKLGASEQEKEGRRKKVKERGKKRGEREKQSLLTLSALELYLGDRAKYTSRSV